MLLSLNSLSLPCVCVCVCVSPVVVVKVGKLKCIVRVTMGNPDDDPLFVDKRNFPTLAKAKARNDMIMTELLKVRGCRGCC